MARLTQFEGRGHTKFPKGPPFADVFLKKFQKEIIKGRSVGLSPPPPKSLDLRGAWPLGFHVKCANEPHKIRTMVRLGPFPFTSMVYNTAQPHRVQFCELEYLRNPFKFYFRICSIWKPFRSIICSTRLFQKDKFFRTVFILKLLHTSWIAFSIPFTVVTRLAESIFLKIPFTP